MSLTDAQVDAVLASRENSCSEDGEDTRPLWYRMDELAGLWGDEFTAMHALAQAVKDARAALRDIAEYVEPEIDADYVDGVPTGNLASTVYNMTQEGLGVRHD